MASVNSGAVCPQCVILAGGLGTRLGDLAAGRPKPLVEVGGQPFLKILLGRAHARGIGRVLLLAGHKAKQIEQFVLAMKEDFSGLRIEISVEDKPLGTAGAIVHAKSKLDDAFLLLNGDSIFDFDWIDLANTAAAYPGAEIMMGLRYETDTSRYGVVETEGNRVIAFRDRGARHGGLINGGVYYVRRSAVNSMPAEGSLERDVLPVLARESRLYAKAYEGFFIDIGTPASLAAAQRSGL